MFLMVRLKYEQRRVAKLNIANKEEDAAKKEDGAEAAIEDETENWAPSEHTNDEVGNSDHVNDIGRVGKDKAGS
jgi:hypothetical protein